MKIYFDENTSPYICRALQELQRSRNVELEDPIEVISIEERFGKSAKDEDWVPQVGVDRAMVITHDFNIMRTRHQRQLCEEYGVGLVIIRPPSKKKGLGYWEQVQLLIKYWLDIVKVAARKSGHYHYELRPTAGLKEM